MPFSGNGAFTLVAGNPVVTGTNISSTVQNNTMNDFANGFTNCVTRDGQSPPTANLPMGARRHTGASAATGTGEYLVYGQDLSGDDLTLTGDLVVGDDATVTGDLAVTGNTTLDTVTIGDVLTVPTIHNANNIDGPGTPSERVKSGTYTPTPSLTTNVSAATGLQLQYIQVGRVVTCSGRISITPTTAANTFTQVEIDPPVGTNFGSLNECGGTGNFISGSTQIPIRITANTTSDLLSIDFLAPQNTAMLCNIHFTYLVS